MFALAKPSGHVYGSGERRLKGRLVEKQRWPLNPRFAAQ